MNLYSLHLRRLAAAASTAAVLSGALLTTVPGTVLAGVANGNGPACPITVTEAGSTTVYPALNQATSGFQSATGCSLTLGQQGSGGGISALNGNTADVAASSALSAIDTTQDYYWKIGADAFVIAVKNDANMSFISGLTTAQVKAIYECQAGSVNWSSFGGPDVTILPRARIDTSGSDKDFRTSFGVVLASENACQTSNSLSRLQTSQDEALAACNNDYQIVYTSLANLQSYGPSGTGCLKAL